MAVAGLGVSALLVAAGVVLGAAGSGEGAAIVAHGTGAGVLPCAACHGADLRGNAAIGAPGIAGLPESVVLSAFDAIAAGRMGKNYVMRHVAQALTPEERRAVAVYLSGLKAGQ